MRTEDVLKTANDTIAVSADEPLARSVEQYVEAMQRQYGFSEEEIRAQISAVLSDLGIGEPTAKDKGKIMKELMPRVKGRADGALVNRLVGEALK